MNDIVVIRGNVKKRIWRWLWKVPQHIYSLIWWCWSVVWCHRKKTKTMIPLSLQLVCEIFSQKLKKRLRNSIKIIFWRINVDWNNTYGHSQRVFYIFVCVWNLQPDMIERVKKVYDGFLLNHSCSPEMITKTRIVDLCVHS